MNCFFFDSSFVIIWRRTIKRPANTIVCGCDDLYTFLCVYHSYNSNDRPILFVFFFFYEIIFRQPKNLGVRLVYTSDSSLCYFIVIFWCIALVGLFLSWYAMIQNLDCSFVTCARELSSLTLTFFSLSLCVGCLWMTVLFTLCACSVFGAKIEMNHVTVTT